MEAEENESSASYNRNSYWSWCACCVQSYRETKYIRRTMVISALYTFYLNIHMGVRPLFSAQSAIFVPFFIFASLLCVTHVLFALSLSGTLSLSRKTQTPTSSTWHKAQGTRNEVQAQPYPQQSKWYKSYSIGAELLVAPNAIFISFLSSHQWLKKSILSLNNCIRIECSTCAWVACQIICDSHIMKIHWNVEPFHSIRKIVSVREYFFSSSSSFCFVCVCVCVCIAMHRGFLAQVRERLILF